MNIPSIGPFNPAISSSDNPSISTLSSSDKFKCTDVDYCINFKNEGETLTYFPTMSYDPFSQYVRTSVVVTLNMAVQEGEFSEVEGQKSLFDSIVNTIHVSGPGIPFVNLLHRN